MLNKSENGFFILEALVAIIIFAIGILGMVKLQFLTAEYSQQSIMRSQISFVLEQYLAETNLTTDGNQLNSIKTDANSRICSIVVPFFTITDSSGNSLPNACASVSAIVFDTNTNSASVFWSKLNSNDRPISISIKAPSL